MKDAARPTRLPVVAIIGRPNVGKSTLFNRLVRRRQAIVDDQAGVTRDRQYAVAGVGRGALHASSTPAASTFSDDSMAIKIRDQAAAALADADIVLFVADARRGPDTARRGAGAHGAVAVRRQGPRARQQGRQPGARAARARLLPPRRRPGLPGLGGARDRPRRRDGRGPQVLPEDRASWPTPGGGGPGRPRRATERRQVLAGQRAARGAIASSSTRRRARRGTPSTRPFSRGDERWVLVDTAGIRRRGRIQADLEKYSVLRSNRAIGRADVCVLVLDATELVTDQDAHIAGAIVEAKKACVVVVNKWDLVDLGPTAGDEYRRLLAERLKHLSWAPVLLASALNGRNIAKLLDLARDAYRGYSRQIPTPELNSFFRRAVGEYKPPTLRAQNLDGLHHPGVDAAAGVRGARQRCRPGALHLPALPRKPDARTVRLRRHVDHPAFSQQDAPRRGETRRRRKPTPASPSTGSSAATSPPRDSA